MNDEINFKFEVINIKLQTKKTGDRKKEAYIKLISDLVEKKIHSAVGENKHIILYSCVRKKNDLNEVDYLYGKIGKGFYFENRSGQAIDIEKLESETIENDTSKIFEVTIADFIFIPVAHRFCILLGEKISGKDMQKFFTDALYRVKDDGDIVVVDIENEPNAIDEILTAKQIHKIDYLVSYSNDDVLGATAALFDKRLKRSQIGKIEIKAESDHNDYMKTDGEELLQGGIELARSNGEIKSATITTKQNIRKTVKSSNTPLKVEFRSTVEKFRVHIVNLIVKRFTATQSD